MVDSYENINYRKAFLRQVIIRADFLGTLSKIEKSFPPELAAQTANYFPISEPRDAFVKEIEISMSGQGVKEKRQEFKEWRFHGKDREKTITFSPQFISISYNKYSKYDIMKEECLDIFAKFNAQFSDVKIGRLGLRYINEIDLSARGIDPDKPLDWNGYINNKLLSPFSFVEEPKSLTRLFYFIELFFGNFHLRCQVGMHNPDFPALIKKKIFILDFDAYEKSTIEFSELSSKLDSYHSKIQDMFEHSIERNLRNLMENHE